MIIKVWTTMSRNLVRWNGYIFLNIHITKTAEEKGKNWNNYMYYKNWKSKNFSRPKISDPNGFSGKFSPTYKEEIKPVFQHFCRREVMKRHTF